jgi:hypothetical protein
MNWLTLVKGSIPSHSEDIAENLERAMTDLQGLDEIDAHGCALAAAIASGNGGLAEEIAMNSPLFGTQEREAAKTAASLTAVDDVYSIYLWHADKEQVDLTLSNFSYNGHETSGGVTPKQYGMYVFASTLVYKNSVNTGRMINTLRAEGVTDSQIQAIAKIAAVMYAINRIIL